MERTTHPLIPQRIIPELCLTAHSGFHGEKSEGVEYSKGAECKIEEDTQDIYSSSAGAIISLHNLNHLHDVSDFQTCLLCKKNQIFCIF